MSEKKQLRQHQLDAKKAIRNALIAGEVPYADCCVSFGKSLLLADIAQDAAKKGRRVLIITPTKELCKQNYDEAFNYFDKEKKGSIGIVCSGLNKNQFNRKVIICTYQSFFSKRATAGRFDLILADECHIVSNNSDTSMRKIIIALQRINPKVMIAGVSGSPYRLGQGVLENDNIEGKALFTTCCYQSNIKEMMKLGYLAHITSIQSNVQVDLSGISQSGKSDFNSKLTEVKFNEIASPATSDMAAKFKENDIHTAVIFTSSIANAEHIKQCWIDQGSDASEIKILTGKTPSGERKKILKWLVDDTGNRYLINIGILTTGFNFPALDCVVLFRATASLSLYCQCVGRVIRAHNRNGEDKIGIVIDYGTNIERLGAIDNIEPPKPKIKKDVAPQKLCDIVLDETVIDRQGITHNEGEPCNTFNILSAKKCKTCGAHFISENEDGKYSMRSKAQILEDSIINYHVDHVDFDIHTGRDSGIDMIKIDFIDAGFDKIHSHYLCLDHNGIAGTLARKFLMSMFKDTSNYYKLSTKGISVKSVFPILNSEKHYDMFFKKISGVSLKPQKDSKYMTVSKVIFEY